MKTKKTMLFIAAMLCSIMATSLTACGDESVEDVPETPKDTTENKTPDDIYADSYFSLRVMRYSSTGYVQTVILSQGGKPTSYFGMPALFHRDKMKNFTFYEGDTLDVTLEYLYILEQRNYPGVPDSLQYYVADGAYPYGSTPVRPLFKNVSAIYYLTDSCFEVKLLEKNSQGKSWSAVVNKKPNGFDANKINELDTINVLTVANNTDERFYPMHSGDVLTVRLARYETHEVQTCDWNGSTWHSKAPDDLHYHIIAPLIAYYGY